jgi:hypothetical protein
MKRGKHPNGTVYRYVRDVVFQHEADECLIWPFSKTPGGYPGNLTVDGVAWVPTRYICFKINGDPPPNHHAAHSCGNRGCVNPRHLSWKTPTENSDDKWSHGTMRAGETHHLAKLTEASVREIRSAKGKTKVTTLAVQFGVSHSLVSMIQKGKRWAHLGDAA